MNNDRTFLFGAISSLHQVFNNSGLFCISARWTGEDKHLSETTDNISITALHVCNIGIAADKMHFTTLFSFPETNTHSKQMHRLGLTCSFEYDYFPHLKITVKSAKQFHTYSQFIFVYKLFKQKPLGF